MPLITTLQTSTIGDSYIINGGFQSCQVANSATVNASTSVPTQSTGYPVADCWFAYCTGANVTMAQVAGASSVQKRIQFTGAASVTAIGFGHRIESINCIENIAGQTVTLSVDLANSLLTTVTWTASYATTTADTFGTIGTPSKTQIATGIITVNSTVTRYNVTFAVSSAAITGVEILFTVGTQTSGTWTIGNVRLEQGTIANPYVPKANELLICQRYYVSATLFVGQNGAYATSYTFPTTMRTTPIGIGGGAGYTTPLLNAFGVSHSQTTNASQLFSFSAYIS
jgi:hypothetical protein